MTCPYWAWETNLFLLYKAQIGNLEEANVYVHFWFMSEDKYEENISFSLALPVFSRLPSVTEACASVWSSLSLTIFDVVILKKLFFYELLEDFIPWSTSTFTIHN